MKKKTKKAIRKAVRRSVQKHGFATGILTGAVATYAWHASGTSSRIGEFLGEVLPRIAEDPRVRKAMGVLSGAAGSASHLFHHEDQPETNEEGNHSGKADRERVPEENRQVAPDTAVG